MSIQTYRDSLPLPSELMSWLGVPALDPQVRVEEWVEGDRRIIRADLPGVDPQRDIHLSVDGGMLHLQGERRTKTHEHHRTEIRYGSFSRSLALPPGTRASDIKAEYVDGVLTVSMPEAGASSAETIEVAVPPESEDGSDRSVKARKTSKSSKTSKTDKTSKASKASKTDKTDKAEKASQEKKVRRAKKS